LEPKDEKLVTVYKTGHEGLIAVIKSILDEAEIKYLVQGENIQNLFGVGILGTGYNPLTGPIIIQVLEEDEEYARELLRDVKEASEEDSEEINPEQI
jgi:hypothetical protein